MSKTFKTTYRIIVGVWLLLSVFIGLQYMAFSSSEGITDLKQGTFVEAITDEVGYLPYVSPADSDKFYQSLLFRSCISPVLDETTISYQDDLCEVTTDDYQTFTIRLAEGVSRWSDGTPINLNDILYTYQNVIGDNYRELGSLDGLSSVQVLGDSVDNSIVVQFPQASIDNMIFFTNFILPSHILANQSLRTYVEDYSVQPVTSGCAVLQPSLRDPTSTVFDLAGCEDTTLRFYQVKAFSELEDIIEYIPTGSLTIDMSLQPLEYPGYTSHDLLINKMQTFFFNTSSSTFTLPKRQAVGELLNAIIVSTDTQDYLIKDPYLFDQYASFALTDSGAIADIRQRLTQAFEYTTPVLETVPSQINFNPQNPQQSYQLQELIQDKYQIILSFDEAYDRISVAHNGGTPYFPASYSAETRSSFYNLNPLFNNISQGDNTYSITAYRDDGSTRIFTFQVAYLADTPQEESVEQDLGDIDPLRLISFEDNGSQRLVADIQQTLQQLGLDEFFEFESYDERNQYEGKLTSRDYEIVLRTINLGLRRDISNLFTQDDPLINPSLRNDSEFAQQMNRYFRTQDATQQEVIKAFIDERFAEQYPLIVAGKSIETISLRDDIENPFPFRLYVLGRRGQYLPALEVVATRSLDWDRLRSIDNMKQFITDGFVQ